MNPEWTTDAFVKGVPYARTKTKGKLKAPAEWSEEIRRQTTSLPLVEVPCELDVEFVLPPDKFPRDFPHGMDLDNLLKRLLDSLEATVFRSAPGGDSIVVNLHARKRRARDEEPTGARIRLRTTPLD